jgi:hypothetical protein
MPEPSIKEHMEVIGADGVHIGTVDRQWTINPAGRMKCRVERASACINTPKLIMGTSLGMRLRTIGPRSLRNGPSALTGCPSFFGVIVCSPVSG